MRENPYRPPPSPPLVLPARAARPPTSYYYRLWLGLAMLISLAQLRFRGVFYALDVELPKLTDWALHPALPLAVLFVGVLLSQVSRRLRGDHHRWINRASVVMVTTLCLAYAISLYLPWITIQAAMP